MQTKSESGMLRLFGRKFTFEQLSPFMMFFGIVVMLCCVTGFEMIGVGLMVGTAFSILLLVLHQHDADQTPAERFAHLRWLINTRRSGEGDGQTLADIPLPIVAIACLIVMVFCGNNLLKVRQQYIAHSYPSVIGLMTRHEVVDIGMVSSALEVEYEYTVAGQRYRGNRMRFLYRPYRVGTEAAKLLCAKWDQGARIPVFYNPQNPVDAALDNTFCKGDQLFLGLNISAIVTALLIGGFAFYYRVVRNRKTQFRITADPVHDRKVIPLSNAPLYGIFILMLTTLSFAGLLTVQVGGLMSMGNAEIPWLVAAIDWMFVITGGLFGATIICCIAERINYGRGRTCQIDQSCKQLIVCPEGLAEEKTVEFGQIDAINVVSQREGCFQFGRKFVPTILYHDPFGQPDKIALQRCNSRYCAVELVMNLRRLVNT